MWCVEGVRHERKCSAGGFLAACDFRIWPLFRDNQPRSNAKFRVIARGREAKERIGTNLFRRSDGNNRIHVLRDQEPLIQSAILLG